MRSVRSSLQSSCLPASSSSGICNDGSDSDSRMSVSTVRGIAMSAPDRAQAAQLAERCLGRVLAALLGGIGGGEDMINIVLIRRLARDESGLARAPE